MLIVFPDLKSLVWQTHSVTDNAQKVNLLFARCNRSLLCFRASFVIFTQGYEMSENRPAKPPILGAYPDARHRARITTDEPRSNPAGKIIAGIVAMLIVCGVSIFVMLEMRPTHPTGPQPGEDARIYRMMDDYGVTDLKTWLAASEGRMVMGLSRAQAERLADNALAMGAKRVLAFNGGIMTVSVVIELPDDAARREKLFTWWSSNWASSGNQFRSDVGQKYLLLIMRP